MAEFEFDLQKAYDAMETAYEAGNEDDAKQLAEMIKQYQASQQPQTAAEEAPKEDGIVKSNLKRAGRFGLGIAQGLIPDTLIGLGQLGARGIDFILPGDQSGLTRGIDKIEEAQERGYQSLREKLGGSGFDAGRLAGNIAIVPLSGGLGAAAKTSSAAGKLAKLGSNLDNRISGLSKVGKQTPPISTQGVKQLPPPSNMFSTVSKPQPGVFERAGKIGGRGLANLSQLALRPISTIASKIDPRAEKFLFGPASNNLTKFAKYGIAGAELPLAARASSPEDKENYADRFNLSKLGLGAGLGMATGPLASLGRASTTPGALATELAKKNMGTLGQQSGKPFLQALESGVAKYFLGGSRIAKKQRETVDLARDFFKKYDDLYSPNLNFAYGSAGIKNGLNKISSVFERKIANNINPKATQNVKEAFDVIQKLFKPSSFGGLNTIDKTGNILRRGRTSVPADEVKDVINKLRTLKDNAFKMGDKEGNRAIKSLIDDVKNEAKKQFGSNWGRQLDKTDKLWKEFKTTFEKQFPEIKADIGSALGLQQLLGSAFLGGGGYGLLGGLPGAGLGVLGSLGISQAFLNPALGRTILSAPSGLYGGLSRYPSD